jgi:hypothetical protein
MAETAVANRDGQIVEQVVLHGDLAELSPKDRVAYYGRVCESLGLNPFTRPFEYIKLNNKLTLYARRDATDQLRSLKGVSVAITSRELVDGVYVVTAKAAMGERTDESIGAVDISSLRGDFRANAMMKAETKAKRRVTLSIVGLGWLEESEVGDIPPKDAKKVKVDYDTGEIGEIAPPEEPAVLFDDSESGIDMDWLRAALNQLQWADVPKYLREKYGCGGNSVRRMVESLPRESQEEFVAEVQRRLDEQSTPKTS